MIFSLQTMPFIAFQLTPLGWGLIIGVGVLVLLSIILSRIEKLNREITKPMDGKAKFFNIFGKLFVLTNFVLSIGFLGVTAVLMADDSNYEARWQVESSMKIAMIDKVVASTINIRQLSENHVREMDRIRSEIARHVEAKEIAMHNADVAILKYSPLPREIQGTQAMLTSLESGLSTAKTSLQTVQASNEDYRKWMLDVGRERDRLVLENAQLTKNKVIAEDDYRDLQENYYVLWREAEALRQELTLMKQMIPEGVDPHNPWPMIDFQVLDIDETIGIVLLNKGELDGVVVGMKVAIYEGETFKAFAIVERRFERASAAKVQIETVLTPIKRGDRAMTSY
ncbi:MAG: hypothetical protein NUW37_02330 [Planctomycetes bacterium]|nr:hypothetical protein [Planctomycetota bacterium]